MDETLFRSLLLDFYGDMLSEKQRELYDLHYNGDLSLREIADDRGTTRQAVWDVVRRTDRVLRSFEEKTGLIAKELRRRERLAEIAAVAETLPDCPEKTEILTMLRELED